MRRPWSSLMSDRRGLSKASWSLLVALVLVACGTSTPSQGTTTKQILIAQDIQGPAPWLDSYEKRFAEIVASHPNVKLIQNVADFTEATQNAQVETMLAQKPDIVIIFAADSNAVVPLFARIKQQGIPPLAAIIPPVDALKPYMVGYVGPNDVTHGKNGAISLADALGGSSATGEVAILRGTPGGSDSVDRATGFKAQLAISAPGLKIVDDQYSDWNDTKKMYDVTTGILQRHPHLVGLYTENDVISGASAQAVADLGLAKQVKIQGTGGACVGFTLLRNGKIVGTTMQDPWVAAQMVFDTSLKVINKQSFPFIQYMNHPNVTLANIDSYECHW